MKLLWNVVKRFMMSANWSSCGRMVVRMWKVPSRCLKPLPGTHDRPVSLSSSRQYCSGGGITPGNNKQTVETR